jgi:hypothetical protein
MFGPVSIRRRSEKLPSKIDRKILESAEKLFSTHGYYGTTTINHVKSIEASRYQATYSMILDRISAGKLVHADETKVTVGGKDGYVWVFTNLENVAFVYSETREGSTLQSVLRTFQGVLVSDFYAAYDSIECAQQKCPNSPDERCER